MPQPAHHPSTPPSALVTGGAGFIGSHIVRRLLTGGAEVRVLDDLSTGRESNLAGVASDIDFRHGDIRDPRVVAAATRGVETVFHHAALPSVEQSVVDPRASLESNVTGTLNVLLAARDADVRRVTFASSSAVYGENPVSPKHERLAPETISPYAVGKLSAEALCRSFTEVYGLETVALRYFNVFGPRQDPDSPYGAVIPLFISAMLRGRVPVINGDGEQTRDFVHVDNVVQANMLGASAPSKACGRTYNIACGGRITLNDLVAEIAAAVGVEPRADHGPEREGDVRHSMADISAARSSLGYEPTVSLADGLATTVAQYRDEITG